MNSQKNYLIKKYLIMKFFWMKDIEIVNFWNVKKKEKQEKKQESGWYC